MNLLKRLTMLGLAVAFCGGMALTGCKKQDDTGTSLEEAAEEAGDKMEEGAEEAGEAMEEAGETLEEEME